MVEVGGRPVLWHIMKVLGAQGITDFVICTGYKSEYIKNYFYNYGASNLDFTVKLGDQASTVFHGSHDEFDWTVTVVDTGPLTPTGGRIMQVRKYLSGEPFFCTYGDGIADVDIAALTSAHQQAGKIATMTTAQPNSRFGVVDVDESGTVTKFREKPKTTDLVNIGYFIFEDAIFNYLELDSTLEEQPLRSLASQSQLSTFQHSGFWQPMDTYREAQLLNEHWQSGSAPWKIWS
jgi:glucose-1-phosphate cytidylyltransferase